MAKALVPQKHGGALRRGAPKAVNWKQMCGEAIQDADVLKVLRKIISGDIREQIGPTITETCSGCKGLPVECPECHGGCPMCRDTGTVDKTIYGKTRNVDRIAAIKVLTKQAGYDEPSKGQEEMTPDESKRAATGILPWIFDTLKVKDKVRDEILRLLKLPLDGQFEEIG